MCNLVQIRFCHIYLNNTRECEFAVCNEGITNRSPFLNDTKNCILLTKLIDLKNTQKLEGSSIKPHRVKIFTHNGISFIIDCFPLSKALTC